MILGKVCVPYGRQPQLGCHLTVWEITVQSNVNVAEPPETYRHDSTVVEIEDRTQIQLARESCGRLLSFPTTSRTLRGAASQ